MNPVPSVSVKVITPSKKSDTRLFILRNVELQKLKTPKNMKNLPLSQLGQEIVAKESFEMGYFQGNDCVWMRNEDDIQEVVKLNDSLGICASSTPVTCGGYFPKFFSPTVDPPFPILPSAPAPSHQAPPSSTPAVPLPQPLTSSIPSC